MVRYSALSKYSAQSLACPLNLTFSPREKESKATQPLVKASALNQAVGPVAAEHGFEHGGVFIVPAESIDEIQAVNQF